MGNDDGLFDLETVRGDPAALARLIDEHRMLKEAIQNSPVLFCVYDRHDRLLASNGSYDATHQLGFQRWRDTAPHRPVTYAELIRPTVEREFPPDEVEDELARRIKTHREANGMPFVRHYETAGWTQVFKYPLPSGAIAGLAIDVNALKAREAELIEAHHAAEAGERAKSIFLAKMSHEIRTPMNGIIGLAETLINGNLTADQRQAIETILDSAEGLMSLINDLLDFSKIEAGKMDLVARPFCLLDLAEALCRLLAPRIHGAGLDLIADLDPALLRPVSGDAARIRQILTNLIGNAAKFTPRGHIRVTLRCTDASDDGHASVTMSVEDTGIGIPEDRQQQVFKAFEQLHDDMPANCPGELGAEASGLSASGLSASGLSASGLSALGLSASSMSASGMSASGTGLGLSITADLISAMGGTLSLTSKPGQGSLFSCTLRLPWAGPPRPVPTGLGRVDLVDPDPLQSAPMRRTLVSLGYDPRLHSDLDTLDFGVPEPLLISGRALPQDSMARQSVLRLIAARQGRSVVLWPRGRIPQAGRGCIGLSEPVGLQALAASLSGRPVAERSRKPEFGPASDLSGLRVLVAEDNRTNRLVIERMLEPRVARLVFAEDGARAVELATAQPFDLILMDMSMPRLDGPGAATAIRRHEKAGSGRRVPILALTANAMASDTAICLEAGMDDFLTKPLRLATLLGALRRLAPAPPVSA